MSLWTNYVVVVFLAIVLALNIALIVKKLPLVAKRSSRAQPPAVGIVPKNSIFHKPENSDCPAGTSLLPAYFTEKDGTKRDACHNPEGDGSIDYLNPGEGFELHIPVRIEPAAEQRDKT